MDYRKKENKKKQESIKSNKKKKKKKVSSSFIKIVVFGVLILGVIGVAAGVGVIKAIIDAAPEIDWENDTAPKGYSSIIYDTDGNEIQQLHGKDANRIYAYIEDIPDYLEDAFIVTEDERYWDHKGIDVKGIFRAAFKNIKDRDITEGASTITQQVIKNNVLSTERSFKRKIQEQYLAIQLEKHLSKEKVLEYYLNTAALGRGTYGVQAASKRYYNKDVSELTIAESAVLACITQRPTFYDPITNPENNRAKQEIILKKMYTQNKITEEEYNTALAEKVYENIQQTSLNFDSQSDYSYFVDEVIREVTKDLQEEKGYSESQANNLVFRGGLSIYVTQNTKMQNIVDKEFRSEENFPPRSRDYSVRLQYSLSTKTKGQSDTVNHYEEKLFKTDKEAEDYKNKLYSEWVGPNDEVLAENALFIPQPQSAMVIMDYYTGHVKAIVGGRGEKKGNKVFNRATQALRQPGSTFKILAAYLPAIDTRGYTLAKVLDDVPTSFKASGGKSYKPKNWYERHKFNYRGLSTVREGIKDSMNILAVKTLNDIGVQTGFDYLLNLGFTSLVDSLKIDGTIYSDKNLPLALGGITKGVTPLELTAAYGAIANNGVYTEPVFYTKVLDHDGKILLEKKPKTNTVMKETTSFLLTNAMESVITNGTAKYAKFKKVNMPIAGKTGTTQNNVDLLFTAYTPHYIGTVWLGYDKNKTMKASPSTHIKLWQKVMEQVHEGLPREEFKKPAGIISVKICQESGKLAVDGLCDKDPRGSRVKYEYFLKGTEPTEPCDVHFKSTICKDSGLFSTDFCPESSKVPKIYINRPEPLKPETWDPTHPPRIADYQYELPASMVGEYCPIHGPVPEFQDNEDDIDNLQPNPDNFDSNNNSDTDIDNFQPNPDNFDVIDSSNDTNNYDEINNNETLDESVNTIEDITNNSTETTAIAPENLPLTIPED
jgi:penicillin-binding protein 1A